MLNSTPLKTIQPYQYSGELQVPYSKSYLQRAIAVSVLAKKHVEIVGYTPSKDAIAATSIAESLGAKCRLDGNRLIVDSREVKPFESVTIHCGEAGLSTRMFSPIAASLAQDVTVLGEGSILSRPMDMVIEALESFGAEVESNEGKLPLHITKGIRSGETEIDGSESSQLLTGLLIALAFMPDSSVVRVKNLKSIPYVQMTLDLLASFGAEIRHENYKTFYVNGNAQTPESLWEYHVEGDWSGASFHVVGAALNGRIRLTGLNPQSAQADRVIVDAVKLAGAQINWIGNDLEIISHELNAFEFDATHCPDLFPPLAALAAFCDGITRINGVSRLASKESNRGLTIQSELGKLGIVVVLDGDEMRITGGSISGGRIDSHNDHRIAMMGAILATRSGGNIEITNEHAVDKSYPDFFDDLLKINRS